MHGLLLIINVGLIIEKKLLVFSVLGPLLLGYHRETELQGGLVMAKCGRLEPADNIYRHYRFTLCPKNRPPFYFSNNSTLSKQGRRLRGDEGDMSPQYSDRGDDMPYVHQNSPFRAQKAKIFLGRGHGPLPHTLSLIHI